MSNRALHLRRTLAVAAAALTGAAACREPTLTDPATSPPVVATPRDTTPVQGLDVARLHRLVDALRSGRHGDVHALLVQRRGELVVEEYFAGLGATDAHSLQSVSKSFTSALIGIAIGAGAITSVDEAVLDFFPQWKEDLGRDPLRAAMVLEDILTMRTGTDYHEAGAAAPHWTLNALPTGWDAFWLARPMVRAPGTFWQYDSGGVIALSSMLRHRTGMHADAYADATLFQALGITTDRWFRNQEGHPHTGGGLWLTPRDMVKLGQLYLQGGVWDGAQVVPEAWVRASLTRHVGFASGGAPPRTTGYGYLWWILEPDPAGARVEPIWAAIGAGGQFVFVIPEHDMVVGVTSAVQTGRQWAPVDFLYGEVLPSVVR